MKTVEVFSNNIEDFGGEANVLKYGENSWFYNIFAQLLIENYKNTILPTKCDLCVFVSFQQLTKVVVYKIHNLLNGVL